VPLNENIARGRQHALIYPVSRTGILVPYRPTEKLLHLPENNFIKQQFLKAMRLDHDVRSFDELAAWLGMHAYPAADARIRRREQLRIGGGVDPGGPEAREVKVRTVLRDVA